MPGRHVNDQQVRFYMTARITRPQATAAAMAGISVATGRRIERDPRPPSSRKERRRPRDRLLRDPDVGRTVLELRTRQAFFGITWQGYNGA